MANDARKNTSQTGRTWADVVGTLPIKIIHWAAVLALGSFAALVAITVYGFFTHQVLTVAGWSFGQEPAIEISRQSEVLRALAQQLDTVFQDQGRGACLKFKDDTFSYCFDKVSGNLVSYNYNNIPWRGLGKSPENMDAK